MMNAAMITKTLRNYHVRPTKTRKAILNIFLDADFALSHADIENKMTCDCDRVTIYRTLDTFLEKGLIHKVADGSGIIRYALGNNYTPQPHDDNHVHFKCVKCNRVYCLPSVDVPALELPPGYDLYSFSIIAEGICENCK